MLLMFLANSVAALNCKSFSCKTDAQLFYPQQCVYASSKSGFYLQTCANRLIPYCQPTLQNSTCTTNPVAAVAGIAWPGETCTQDSNCVYGMCFQSKCNSKYFLAPCTSHDQCNPGFACNQNTKLCTFQLEISAQGCSSDFDCVNGAGCNQGYCQAYFSIEPGDPVDSCVGGVNYLCQHFLCGGPAGQFVCAGAVKSYTGSCDTADNCVVNDPITGLNFGSSCACSYSVQPKRLCAQLPGDNEYSAYLQGISGWLSSKKARLCNTSRRFSMECIKMYADSWYNVLLNYYYVQTYPMNYMNEDCTKSIFNRQYWDLTSNVSVVTEVWE